MKSVEKIHIHLNSKKYTLFYRTKKQIPCQKITKDFNDDNNLKGVPN